MKRAAPLAILLLLAAPALADSKIGAAPLANVQLADPAKERAAKQLMETIRCLVCQGQSIADSDAEMAGDMRSLIRERIQQGEKPEAIRKWLVQRYGDWVTYAPPTHGSALALWFLPLALLIMGGLLALGRFKRRAS
ncbi:MAG: cytochrome c-type biogenesis protein CcmH [Chakrabartia sp.]